MATSSDPGGPLAGVVAAPTEVLYDYGDETTPNLERIAAFRPDLIVLGAG